MARLRRELVLGLVAMGLAGSLAACKRSEAEVLETHYEQANAKVLYDSAAQCTETRRVADAWAREGNQTKFDHWKELSDSFCGLASSSRG